VLLLLLQIALDADGNSYQYEDVTIVEGSAINSDLVFSADHTHLYVMTSNKVRHRAPSHTLSCIRAAVSLSAPRPAHGETFSPFQLFDAGDQAGVVAV